MPELAAGISGSQGLDGRVARGLCLGELRGGESGGCERVSLTLAQGFVTEIDEGLVLADGAAANAAELITDELGFGVRDRTPAATVLVGLVKLLASRTALRRKS